MDGIANFECAYFSTAKVFYTLCDCSFFEAGAVDFEAMQLAYWDPTQIMPSLREQECDESADAEEDASDEEVASGGDRSASDSAAEEWASVDGKASSASVEASPVPQRGFCVCARSTADINNRWETIIKLWQTGLLPEHLRGQVDVIAAAAQLYASRDRTSGPKPRRGASSAPSSSTAAPAAAGSITGSASAARGCAGGGSYGAGSRSNPKAEAESSPAELAVCGAAVASVAAPPEERRPKRRLHHTRKLPMSAAKPAASAVGKRARPPAAARPPRPKRAATASDSASTPDPPTATASAASS